jgi:hypothetical protein
MAPCVVRNLETGAEWEVEPAEARYLLYGSHNNPQHEAFVSGFELVEGDVEEEPAAVERSLDEVAEANGEDAEAYGVPEPEPEAAELMADGEMEMALGAGDGPMPGEAPAAESESSDEDAAPESEGEEAPTKEQPAEPEPEAAPRRRE